MILYVIILYYTLLYDEVGPELRKRAPGHITSIRVGVRPTRKPITDKLLLA